MRIICWSIEEDRARRCLDQILKRPKGFTTLAGDSLGNALSKAPEYSGNRNRSEVFSVRSELGATSASGKSEGEEV